MKKHILLLVFLLTGFAGFSQGLGIHLDYNSATFKETENGNAYEYPDFYHIHRKGGLNIGINYDYELTDNLYAEFGLSYMSFGRKDAVDDEGANGGTLHITHSFNYLHIPLHLRYNFEVGDNMYVFGYGGMSFGLALSGSSKNDEDGNDAITYKFGNDHEKDDFKPTDFGLSIGAGILYKNFELRLGLYNGLKNVNLSDEYGLYHRSFMIGVGYRFEL